MESSEERSADFAFATLDIFGSNFVTLQKFLDIRVELKY
jgi:hypothetical protein